MFAFGAQKYVFMLKKTFFKSVFNFRCVTSSTCDFDFFLKY